MSSSRFHRGCIAAAAVVLASAPTRVALASPESDARELFARGRELRQSGDCARAVPIFRTAWATYPEALGSLRNIAECEEEVGHVVAARRAWLDLAEAARSMRNERYQDWDKDAADAAARLHTRVATVVVDVVVRTGDRDAAAVSVPGIEVSVNDEPLPLALVGTTLERDPGPVRIHARAPDAPPVETSVVLAPGEVRRVTLRLERAVTKPPPISPPADARVNARPDGSARRTLGWAAIGVGAAAFVGAGLTFVARQSALRELDAQCPTHRNCDESLRDTVNRGETMSLLTAMLLPLGILGVGGGFALVLTSTPAPTATARRVELRPSLGGLAIGGTL